MLCSSDLVISIHADESQQQRYSALVSVKGSTMYVRDGAEGH
jgi:N-acetylmuramoyl-L-alanine amidase